MKNLGTVIGMAGLLLALAGCGAGGDGHVAGENGTVRILVASAGRATPELFDAGLLPELLRFNIGGADFSTRTHEFPMPDALGEPAEHRIPLPVGTERWIEAEVLNGAGEALFAGRSLFDVPSGGDTVEVRILLGPVQGPTGFSASGGPETVNLSWTPVHGIATYNVYRSGEPGVIVDPDNLLGRVEANGFLHGGLVPGNVNYYIVTAVNAAGESEPSVEVHAAAVPPLPGQIPGGNVVPGDGRVMVSWDEAPWASSYNLYWSDEQVGGKFRPLAREGSPFAAGGMQLGITGTAYTIEGLVNGTTYSIAARGVNSGGEGQLFFFPPVVPRPDFEASPSGFTGLPGGPGQVMLSWEPLPGAQGYVIYWSPDPGAVPGRGTSIRLGNAANYVHDGLPEGNTFCYVITAVGFSGIESSPSGEICVQAGMGPLLASARLVASARDGAVLLSWSMVEGAESYTVYWNTRPGVTPGNGNVISGVSRSSLLHGGLTNGVTYYYVVVARNANGEGPPSNGASATPTGGGVVLLPDLSVTNDGLSLLGQDWDLLYNVFNGGTASAPVTGPPPAIEVAVCTDPFGLGTNCFCDLVQGSVPAGGSAAMGAAYTMGFVDLIMQNNWYIAVDPRDLINELNEGNNRACRGSHCLTPPNIAGLCPPVAPAAPANLQAFPGDSFVDLTWSPVPGATSYTLYWSISSPVSPATGSPIQVGPNTGFVHAPLVNGTTYFYVVTASNAAGEGLPSQAVSATPTAPAPLLADLSVFGDQILDVGLFDWQLQFSVANGGDAPAPATGPPPAVEVAICSDPSGTFMSCVCDSVPGVIPPGSSAFMSSFYTQGASIPSTNWYIEADPRGLISEYNEADNSACSGTLCTSPPSVAGVCPPVVPAAPTGLAKSPIGTMCELPVVWNRVSGASSYQLYYAMTSGVTSATGTLAYDGPLTTHTIIDCPTVMVPTYYFVVTARNGAGTSPDSGELAAQPNP